MTKDNCEDVKQLLASGRTDKYIAEFAKAYSGKTIQLEGYINFIYGEDEEPILNILTSENNSSGPIICFRGINFEDGSLSGIEPGSLKVGQDITFTAKIQPELWNSGNALYLKYVSIDALS